MLCIRLPLAKLCVCPPNSKLPELTGGGGEDGGVGVAPGGGVLPEPPGMINTCPTLIRLGLAMLLAAAMAW